MPLLSDRIRDRIPWLQLAIESVHVALSVLLALTLNACDHAQEPKRVHRALQGLREELTGMKEILRVGIPHPHCPDRYDAERQPVVRAPPVLRFVSPNNEA